MTNGEMIQKVFKGCEVCEPIIEDDIIHVVFADKKDSAIGFDWSWWNAEYKEPTTKNDLGVDCISRQIISDYVESHIQEINTGYGDLNRHTNSILRMIVGYIENMPSVTPQEPVLDKIRAEIIERDKNVKAIRSDSCCFFTAEEVLQILDKYKAESENT